MTRSNTSSDLPDINFLRIALTFSSCPGATRGVKNDRFWSAFGFGFCF